VGVAKVSFLANRWKLTRLTRLCKNFEKFYKIWAWQFWAVRVGMAKRSLPHFWTIQPIQAEFNKPIIKNLI